MQHIKHLTEKYDTRTILIAHFQKLDESKRPTMTNFKDSISIAQTANTVIMLWRDKKE
jgi:replicative DNA helicase